MKLKFMENTKSNMKKLAENYFNTLPLGEIKPTGWLKNQLQIQANGLSGNLDEFWPDIADSGWIGGKAEGWERGPYWLDGLVPLAYQLEDGKLIAKVKKWMNYILDNQDDDGWLGPVSNVESQKYDPWPVSVFVKAAIQYFEIENDERVIPVLTKFYKKVEQVLDSRPMREWAAFRWPDFAIGVFWLYDKTGDEWLLNLAERADRQSYNWKSHFADLPFKNKSKSWAFDNHVVNHTMALKLAAMFYRTNGKFDEEKNAAINAIKIMDQYHGQITGVFSGDESLAGLSPSQGTELCAVIEYMFSLEKLIETFGCAEFADRLEKITFNALPATFKPDMWAHQYVQQANQVICKIEEDRVYTSNGPDANIFGLEPHFGCCTSNMHQGWPKFVSHLWMKKNNDTLAAIAYAPSQLETEINRTKISILTETDYPFNEEITMKISVDKPADFSIMLRIPAWCKNPEIEVNDKIHCCISNAAFQKIERMWQTGDVIKIKFPFETKITKRPSGGVAIEKGPLVFSLKIEEEWKRVNEDKPNRELPHADWEVYPKSDWNFGLKIDETINFEFKKIGECPFSPDGAPVIATTKTRKIPEWKIEHNAAGEISELKIKSSDQEEEIKLIPYGCTNLRVTEFPEI